MRVVFGSLKCCLDIWLSNMFDCIHVYIFLFFEKLFLSNLNSFSIPLDSKAIYRAFWASLLDRYYHNLDPSRLLIFNPESYSTATRSIEEVSVCLIASRSIEVYLLWTPLDSYFLLFISWQLLTPLDPSRNWDFYK